MCASGKVAVITGGAHGIGKAVADAFRAEEAESTGREEDGCYRGETILLKQFGKTTVLHPDEITQVRLEEKYLLYSFSTKPKEMLVIEAPGVLWQIRSGSITCYDRVINYFMEQEEDGSL